MVEETELILVGEALERIGDKEIYREIVGFFINQAADTMQKLEAALANQSPEGTRLAHSLKSSSATVGAESLSALAAELEKCCRENHFAEANMLFATIKAGMPLVLNSLRKIPF